MCDHSRFEIHATVDRQVHDQKLKSLNLKLAVKCVDCGQEFYVAGTAPDLILKEREPDGTVHTYAATRTLPVLDVASSITPLPPLSIIIPVLNDKDEANATIRSIRATSPPDVEIIVVDDASDNVLVIEDKSARLIRYKQRIGAGAARHAGAFEAKAPYLLLLDAHMRFDPGWYEPAMARLRNTKLNVVWCAACMGLSEENMELTPHTPMYTGADLIFWDPITKRVFEGVWRPEVQHADDYEIQCLMGACYFMRRDWFFHIHGLEWNRKWGSEEPFLSLKTWLAGGTVRLMKSVKIGHKFRNSTPYSTELSSILYNKIRAMKELLPDELYQFLLAKIPDDKNKFSALQQVKFSDADITEEQAYYKKIFTHDVYWFFEKFGIKNPLDETKLDGNVTLSGGLAQPGSAQVS